jgi:2'-5' RNA ligase
MTFVVISYPNMSREDFSLVQTIRAEYDSQYQLIGPHFTLVFPCPVPDQVDLVRHVGQKVQGIKRIPFVIRQAIWVEGNPNGQYNLCLVPDAGSNEIKKLHDDLYTGLLAAELRRDIPFIPHITIGNRGSPEILSGLAAKLNARGLNIAGVLDSLEIASLEGQKIGTLERIPLE